MKCPSCGHKSTPVRDSRVRTTTGNIHRRRKCHNCGYLFSTAEITQNKFNFFLRLEEASKRAEVEAKAIDSHLKLIRRILKAYVSNSG